MLFAALLMIVASVCVHEQFRKFSKAASALPRPSRPHRSLTAHSRNQITSRRVLREMQNECSSLVVVHQLVDAPNEFRCLDDRDTRLRCHTSV